METSLGVDTGWVDDLVCEAFDGLALDGSSLGPILRRARAAGLSESRLAVIIVRWLGANGGTFATGPNGCVLNYQGAEYPVMAAPPFASLIWRLSRDSGHSVLLTSSVYESVLYEALYLAEVGKSPTAVAAQSVAGSASSTPASTFLRAIQRLFELTTGPDAKAREAAETFANVNRTTGQVDISGTWQDVCATLNLASGKPFLSGVDDLRKALTEATAELKAAGVTWEESSAGKGKRRVFHLKRSA
ncbi:MAG: hypothetical protein NT025_04570 [bacterium]|nr:hypothetical protein [bacterium]